MPLKAPRATRFHFANASPTLRRGRDLAFKYLNLIVLVKYLGSDWVESSNGEMSSHHERSQRNDSRWKGLNIDYPLT
jgi:hypothetical protein